MLYNRGTGPQQQCGLCSEPKGVNMEGQMYI